MSRLSLADSWRGFRRQSLARIKPCLSSGRFCGCRLAASCWTRPPCWDQARPPPHWPPRASDSSCWTLAAHHPISFSSCSRGPRYRGSAKKTAASSMRFRQWGSRSFVQRKGSTRYSFPGRSTGRAPQPSEQIPQRVRVSVELTFREVGRRNEQPGRGDDPALKDDVLGHRIPRLKRVGDQIREPAIVERIQRVRFTVVADDDDPERHVQ